MYEEGTRKKRVTITNHREGTRMSTGPGTAGKGRSGKHFTLIGGRIVICTGARDVEEEPAWTRPSVAKGLSPVRMRKKVKKRRKSRKKKQGGFRGFTCGKGEQVTGAFPCNRGREITM